MPVNQDQLVAILRDSMEATSDARPMYRKLADAMNQLVQTGELQAEHVLPGERLLADRLGVSRVTVRRTMEYLSEQGMLVRKHGARTVIMPRVEKALSQLIGFSEEIRSRGMRPGTRWLTRDTGLPSTEEGRALQLAPGELVMRLCRIRLADDQPIALERAVVPATILSSSEQVGDSLYDAFRRQGANPASGEQRIRAALADRQDALHLGIAEGAPMLIVERRCYKQDGQAIEFTETRYNGDVYDFVTEVSPDAR